MTSTSQAASYAPASEATGKGWARDYQVRPATAALDRELHGGARSATRQRGGDSTSSPAAGEPEVHPLTSQLYCGNDP